MMQSTYSKERMRRMNSVRRAFTAQIIINHIQARDGECIDNMDQALDRAVANGVKNLVVQPTHLMHGAEYDELMESVEAYADKFESVKVAEPLLGEVGADAETVNDDKAAVAETITAEAVSEAAKELFITQPSLTKSVKELEKEMNITIFDRTNKGITVSKEGEIFLGYARQVLEQTALI